MELLSIRSPVGSAPIYYTPETDSTMDDVARLIADGTPHGTVVLTGFQRVGRGRREGRSWWSPRSEALMFTVAINDPPRPALESLRMATAAAAVVTDRYGLDVRIKWPNDLLVGDLKLCGILADARAGRVSIGMGLNVFQTSFPPEIDLGATSISRSLADGLDVADRFACLCDLLVDVLERYVEYEHDWFERMQSRLWRAGESVTVIAPDGRRTVGVVAGVSPDGELLLQNSGLHRVVAGDVSVSRPVGSR